MKIKVLMTAIILGLALPVAADFVQSQEAHEVRLSELRLPQNEHWQNRDHYRHRQYRNRESNEIQDIVVAARYERTSANDDKQAK